MEPQAQPRGTPAFGELLRRHRLAASLTQEELAERAELSPRGLRYLEQGLRRPYPETVTRLADALALSADARHAFLTSARAARASAPVPQQRAGSATLPVPPGPVIGRERELAVLPALLRREDVRILTLTGPGGVGKTRLALAVASALQPDFSGGVRWVPLAALADPHLVESAVAQALGLRETGPQPLRQTLIAALRDRPVLLLLDNFEHLLAAAPLVSALVTSCPRVQVLVTSRAALRLRGEYEFPVAPLPLPDEPHGQPVYALAANPAVDLFLRRAQAVSLDFVLTGANAATVAAICGRLEGLPLALELAAARIRVLAPGAMLARLDHRLALLTGGAADLPARQQTMRATIGWSYDLLDPAGQTLFRRLAVFAGGCDLLAMEAVCGGGGDLPTDILDWVEHLHRSSLLQLEQASDEGSRFVMLETVREYALERLREHREEHALRAVHARYYLTFAEEGAAQFYTAAHGAWLARLAQEHDNFRAALRWCVEERDAELGLRLTAALWMLWYVRGSAEGRAHLAAVLALPEAATVAAPRARSLLGAGQLALLQGDYASARAFLAESVALYRAVGDERGVAEGLLVAGFIARVAEEYDTARGLLEEALARARASDHRFIMAASLHHVGMLAAAAEADYATAQRVLEESLAAYRLLGAQRFTGLVALSLGEVLRARGDTVRARDLLRDGLRLLHAAGDQPSVPLALDVFAQLAHDDGAIEQATRLSGAAARLRERSGAHQWPDARRSAAHRRATARAALGDAAYQAAWAQGQAMTSEEVIAYVLQDPVVPGATPAAADMQPQDVQDRGK